ncbi:undecaprenyl-diphosphate phosphatase [Chloroflexota bacterium]
MNIFKAFILGIIQGLTEFIPVSSTAHLLIGQELLSVPASQEIFAFLVIIQTGTILSLIVYFRNDLWRILISFIHHLKDIQQFKQMPFDARLGWYIIIATLPALFGGYLLRDALEILFNKPFLGASIRLLTAALIMFLGEIIGRNDRKLDSINWKDGLFIGIMQIIAVFPGASRSGTTISAGLFRKFERPSAARFAFLISVPVMLAAGGFEILNLFSIGGVSNILPYLVVGLISSAVVGWFAVRWLLGYLNNHSLLPFAAYCLVIGLMCLIWSIL